MINIISCPKEGIENIQGFVGFMKRTSIFSPMINIVT
jgi:hypothetical protein